MVTSFRSFKCLATLCGIILFASTLTGCVTLKKVGGNGQQSRTAQLVVVVQEEHQLTQADDRQIGRERALPPTKEERFERDSFQCKRRTGSPRHELNPNGSIDCLGNGQQQLPQQGQQRYQPQQGQPQQQGQSRGLPPFQYRYDSKGNHVKNDYETDRRWNCSMSGRC